MNTKMYVGNLSYEAENSDLESLFKEFGNVAMVNVVTARESGRGRGFGFVEMKTKEEAEQAILSLNEKEFMGRALIVNMAKPRVER